MDPYVELLIKTTLHEKPVTKEERYRRGSERTREGSDLEHTRKQGESWLQDSSKIESPTL